MNLKKILIGSAVMCLTSCIAFAEAEDISFKYSENGFDITMNSKLSLYDRVNVTVLKAEKKFEDIKSYTDISIDNVYDIKTYTGKDISDINGSFYSYVNDGTMPIMPNGWYNIKVTTTDLSGEHESVVYRYPNLSGETRNDIWRALSTTSADGFEKAWKTYASQIYWEEDYADIYGNCANIGKYYVQIRDSVYDTSSIKTFTLEEDAIECAEYALSLYSLEERSKNEAKPIFEKYGLPYFEIYEYKNDFDAFYLLFSKESSDLQKFGFSKAMKRILAYANMQDGTEKRTVSDVAENLKKNADLLDINLSYATNKGVDLNSVAGKISTDNIISYYEDTSWFNNIVDGIAASNIQNAIIYGGDGGGGTPGGKGGTTTTNSSAIPPQEIKTESTNETFSDLSNYAWAKEQIEYLYKNKIIDGVGNNNFEPERNVTREEFVTMLVRAFGLSVKNGEEKEFSDVSPDAWYSSYIKIASSNGVVSGKDDGSFGIGENITRQDMTVMLLNIMRINDLSIVPQDAEFSDRNQISDYAIIAVDTLAQLKIVNGYSDNTFLPNGFATRAEAAVVVGRMLTYIKGGI